MKELLRYLYVILACLIIAGTINIFVVPNELLSYGSLGISQIIYYISKLDISLSLLLINIMILLFSSMFLKKETIKKYFLTSILIPLFILITKDINLLLKIDFDENIMDVLVSSFLLGFGYSIIYKQGLSAGTTFLLEETVGKILRFNSKIYSWIVDIIILLVLTYLFGYTSAIYSLIIILISKEMITKTRFGISNSKMFYIITKKENEVKDFIIHDLKYEISVIDVKGGFSKKQSKIIISLISTADYYRLKEGLKVIDPSAFIAITDTYDVVNSRSF